MINDHIGPIARTAYALAIWPTEVVSRATLRALLPPGTSRYYPLETRRKRAANFSGPSRNRITGRLQDALRDFDHEGLISRGTEFVKIRDRDALMQIATKQTDGKVGNHWKFLGIERAAQSIRTDLEAETRDAVRALRLDELRFIEWLMQPGNHASARHRGDRSYRKVPE